MPAPETQSAWASQQHPRATPCSGTNVKAHRTSIQGGQTSQARTPCSGTGTQAHAAAAPHRHQQPMLPRARTAAAPAPNLGTSAQAPKHAPSFQENAQQAPALCSGASTQVHTAAAPAPKTPSAHRSWPGSRTSTQAHTAAACSGTAPRLENACTQLGLYLK